MNQEISNAFDNRCCSNVWTKFLSLMNVLELVFWGRLMYEAGIRIVADELAFPKDMFAYMDKVIASMGMPMALFKLVPEGFIAITVLIGIVALILKLISSAAALFGAFGSKRGAWNICAKFHGAMEWTESFAVITLALFAVLRFLLYTKNFATLPVYSFYSFELVHIVPAAVLFLIGCIYHAGVKKAAGTIALHIKKDAALPVSDDLGFLNVLIALVRTAVFALISYVLIVYNHTGNDMWDVIGYFRAFITMPAIRRNITLNAVAATALAFYSLKQLIVIFAYIHYRRIAKA